jgi:sRNA-binding carbon storage regulator CsrA
MALVRKLKAGDRLTIGDGVTLDCLKSGTHTLQLAISAPDGVAILVQSKVQESFLHPPDPTPPPHI